MNLVVLLNFNLDLKIPSSAMPLSLLLFWFLLLGYILKRNSFLLDRLGLLCIRVSILKEILFTSGTASTLVKNHLSAMAAQSQAENWTKAQRSLLLLEEEATVRHDSLVQEQSSQGRWITKGCSLLCLQEGFENQIPLRFHD
jgi:hypothetical protein